MRCSVAKEDGKMHASAESHLGLLSTPLSFFLFLSTPSSSGRPCSFSWGMFCVSPAVKDVSSVTMLTWERLSVVSGTSSLLPSSAAEPLGTDMGSWLCWEAAWVTSASLAEALGDRSSVFGELWEDFESLGWLGVSAAALEALWGNEEAWESDFRLGFASFPLLCAAAAPASLDTLDRVVAVEVGMVFVVHPVFFGWEDLAEETQKDGNEWKPRCSSLLKKIQVVQNYERYQARFNQNSVSWREKQM